jgi:hypothetical protein
MDAAAKAATLNAMAEFLKTFYIQQYPLVLPKNGPIKINSAYIPAIPPLSRKKSPH